jgi:hypothetical protein
MDQKTRELIAAVNSGKEKLEKDQAELAQIRANCAHDWEPIKDASEHFPAHDEPGDPPGTMGVDWRPGCHVPEKIVIKWKRTCKICGQTQVTSQTEKHMTQTPKFSA